MSSYTFNFRPSSKQGCQKGSIFLRVIHERRCVSLTTPYKVYPHEWDSRNKCLLLAEESSPRYWELCRMKEKMNMDRFAIGNHIQNLNRKGTCSLSNIANFYKSRLGRNSLSGFVYKMADEMELSGRIRTARAYRSALARLLRFNRGKDIKLHELDQSILKRYENYLKEEGLRFNTISFYMRILRSAYNKAVLKGFIERPSENPFSNVYTGIKSSPKRCLYEKEMKLLYNLHKEWRPLPDNRSDSAGTLMNENYYDSLSIFLFCFHARGMSFVDMAHLRWKNIKNGRICYNRKKTNTYLEVKITRDIENILAHFRSRAPVGEDYIFPIIKNNGTDHRKQYESGLRIQNLRLAKIARIAGIDRKITTHVARHTWATLAKKLDYSALHIQEALGHSDLKTTTRYLGEFESFVIDKLTEKISGSIK